MAYVTGYIPPVSVATVGQSGIDRLPRRQNRSDKGPEQEREDNLWHAIAFQTALVA